jgi:hypothetical protein
MNENPWRRWLEEDKPDKSLFVLPQDKENVQAFNAKFKDKHPDLCLHLEFFPVPFVGKREVPVVLLGNITTVIGDDITHSETAAFMRNPAYLQEMRKNLLHQIPHLDLVRECAEAGKGFWKRRLRHLLDEFGEDLLPHRIMTIEHSPYRSYKSYGHDSLSLPSQAQAYSHSLVRDAVKQKKVIVLRLGKKRWCKAVPELGEYPFRENKYYPRLVWLKSRNPVISESNCGGAGYQEIVSAIRAAGKLTNTEINELVELRSHLKKKGDASIFREEEKRLD